MKLHAKSVRARVSEPKILKVTRDMSTHLSRIDLVLCVESFDEVHQVDVSDFPLVLSIKDGIYNDTNDFIAGLESLAYLSEGDVIAVNQKGDVRVLFRKTSNHNFIFVSNNCNSLCLMCSQPPALDPEPERTSEHHRLIELLPPSTIQLGITGGEPTFFREGFLQLVAHCKELLPDTELHVLSNGRAFADTGFAIALKNIEHPALTMGIPLYADIDSVHDHVVQIGGAFTETVHGIYNLAEQGVDIEIRNVLSRLTVRRLRQWGEYLCRNMTFVRHIALMGMEMTGFVHRNIDDLWIDPYDYGKDLSAVCYVLNRSGFNVSLYNHQLCTIPSEIWPYSVQSISDWKNVYLPECSDCAVKEICGGLFQSGTKKRSIHIAPIATTNLS